MNNYKPNENEGYTGESLTRSGGSNIDRRNSSIGNEKNPTQLAIT